MIWEFFYRLLLYFNYNNNCIWLDRALAWFGSFGATETEDDSSNILDVKKKQYRDFFFLLILHVKRIYMDVEPMKFSFQKFLKSVVMKCFFVQNSVSL